MPAGSPTPGFTHSQSVALLTAARQPANPCDFALVAMPGLPGSRIFETTAANITDPGEQHAHRVLRADLRDVQIAARHADPRTTMRYDRARTNHDRHPNHILTAHMASGTRPSLPLPRRKPARAARHCRIGCVACEGPPQSRIGLRCGTREPDGSSGTLGRAPCPVASRVPADGSSNGTAQLPPST